MGVLDPDPGSLLGWFQSVSQECMLSDIWVSRNLRTHDRKKNVTESEKSCIDVFAVAQLQRYKTDDIVENAGVLDIPEEQGRNVGKKHCHELDVLNRHLTDFVHFCGEAVGADSLTGVFAKDVLLM